MARYVTTEQIEKRAVREAYRCYGMVHCVSLGCKLYDRVQFYNNRPYVGEVKVHWFDRLKQEVWDNGWSVGIYGVLPDGTLEFWGD